MTIMFYDSVATGLPITSSEWTQVSSKTGTLRATGNFIFLSSEYGGTSSNVAIGIRVLLNGNEVAFDYHMPSIANQYKKFTDFGIYIPVAEEEVTLSIEVRALAAGQTVLTRRIRLMVQQV